jgi:hypothetical protein
MDGNIKMEQSITSLVKGGDNSDSELLDKVLNCLVIPNSARAGQDSWIIGWR